MSEIDFTGEEFAALARLQTENVLLRDKQDRIERVLAQAIEDGRHAEAECLDRGDEPGAKAAAATVAFSRYLSDLLFPVEVSG